MCKISNQLEERHFLQEKFIASDSFTPDWRLCESEIYSNKNLQTLVQKITCSDTFLCIVLDTIRVKKHKKHKRHIHQTGTKYDKHFYFSKIQYPNFLSHHYFCFNFLSTCLYRLKHLVKSPALKNYKKWNKDVYEKKTLAAIKKNPQK